MLSESSDPGIHTISEAGNMSVWRFLVKAIPGGEPLRVERLPESAGTAEAAKVKAEFQRELYKVADSRMASSDSQAGVIVAAAVTVAGFAAAATRDRQVNMWLFWFAGVAAAVTALLALYSRRDHPVWPGAGDRDMQTARSKAEEAVGAFYEAEMDSAESAYACAFETWHHMATSLESRRKRKQLIFGIAVAVLLVELALVLALLAAS